MTTIYSYNAMGNQIKITTSGSGVTTRITKFEYDSKGRYIVKTTNPLGQESFASYDHRWGAPLSTIGVDGLTTTYSYDEFGNIVDKVTPDNVTTTYALNWDIGLGGAGSPTDVNNSVFKSTTTVTGRPTTTTWFDNMERERKIERDGFNQKIYQVTSYDERGNVKTSTSPFYLGGSVPVVVTTNTYNDYNQIASSTNSAGTVTYNYQYGVVFTYPPLMSANTFSLHTTKVTITQADGSIVVKTTDSGGRIMQVNDGGGVLNYKYNSHGKQEEILMDNAIWVSKMEYDAFGNQTKLTDKNAGVTEYLYDAYDDLIYEKSANGDIFTMLYDKLGRLVTKSGQNGAVVYDYIQNGNGLNRINSITNPNGIKKEFTYDFLSRLVESKETIDNIAYTTNYQYDGNNNIASITYPSGYKINKSYNGAGFPTIISDNNNNNIWNSPSMNAFNQYTFYQTGNGLQTSKSYDEYGTPMQILTSGVQLLDFVFDPQNGNLISKNDVLNGNLEEYSYDNLNRLTQTKLNGNVQIALNYGANGNIQSKTDAGTFVYDNNRVNGVVRVSNPSSSISLNTQDITYTSFNKISNIKESNNELYITYGPNYNRKKTIYTDGTNTTTKYFLGNYEKIEDALSGDVTEIHYIAGGTDLVAMYVIKNGIGQIYYTQTDHLGSILSLTDDLGNVVTEQNFDAWGRHRNPSNYSYTGFVPPSQTTAFSWLTRGFTGHEHYEQFGIVNMNGRMYDPIIGRMLSTDNFVQNPFSTQSFNRFSYVNNNPLKFADPTGEFLGLPVVFWAIAAWITAGAAHHFAGGTSSQVFTTSSTAAIFVLSGSLSGGFSLANGAKLVSNPATISLIVASFTNSAGNSLVAISNHQEPNVGVNFGAVSYNFTSGELGYLGKSSNSVWQNVNHLFGAAALISDASKLFSKVYELTSEDVDYLDNLTASKDGGGVPESPGQIDYQSATDGKRVIHTYKWIRYKHSLGTGQVDLNEAFSNLNVDPSGSGAMGFSSGVIRIRFGDQIVRTTLDVGFYQNLKGTFNAIIDFDTGSNGQFLRGTEYWDYYGAGRHPADFRWTTPSKSFDFLYDWLGYGN